MKTPVRILLIEDNPEYRRVIKLALEWSDELELVYATGMAERALRRLNNIPDEELPDVILLDLNLLGMNGLEALKELRALLPDIKIIILTQSNQEADVVRALSLGANGYLLKSADMEEIKGGIRAVMNDGAPIDPGVAKFILQSLRNQPVAETKKHPLTEREIETLKLLSEGLVKKEIGHKLKISTFTVNAHVRNIYEKLEVINAPSAIARAFRSGIFKTED